MKRRILLLVLALVCFCLPTLAEVTLPADLTAIEAEAFAGDASLTGVLTLPEGVLSVGSAAFGETGLYALRIPAGCASLGAEVLRGTEAAYLYLEGADTPVDTAALGSVPYVFAPADSPAALLDGRYVDTAQLAAAGSFYFRVTEDAAYPLCPVDREALPAAIALPDTVDGKPVVTLEGLVMPGCDAVQLFVPCLPMPEGLNARYLCTLAVTQPTTADEIAVGSPATFTAEVTGKGQLTYRWTIQNGTDIHQEQTDGPSITYTPVNEADLTVTLSVTDAASHTAIGTADFAYPVPGGEITCRALLVGNVYAATSKPLPGCDTDARALQTMLSTMKGSGYTATVMIDLTADGIASAIRSTFAGADENDVSLFSFSGHGTNTGKLVGTSSTYLTPAQLRAVLDEIPGTKIILLDCCYSGSFISKGDAPNPAAFNAAIISAFSSIPRGDNDLAAGGYCVITACTSQQQSQSLSGDGSHYWGAFTYGVCYGSGYDAWKQQHLSTLPADVNGDGAITLSECCATVQERIDYLNPMTDNTLDQAMQSYGDGSFVLWRR